MLSPVAESEALLSPEEARNVDIVTKGRAKCSDLREI